ncbi:glycerophosphodiester phosphodiesterase [bacterium]|nr:glycerophosphodiester phosphodiesterase [bacterium]
MKRMLVLLFTLLLFGAALQLGIHWWVSTPAPRYRVFEGLQFEVIAHQGGAGIAPPNTLTAMRAALAAGTDVLEMDIRSTRDGRIVVFHDQTLDRTTSCSGAVTAKTLVGLQACDKGYFFMPGKTGYGQRSATGAGGPGNPDPYPFRNHGIRIPTLDEVFSAFPGQRMVIEIKQAEPSLVSGFCEMIRAFNMQDHVVIGSFKQDAMDEFREACPEVATSATLTEALTFFLADKIGLSSAISPVYAALQIPAAVVWPESWFLPDFKLVSSSLVKAAHARGIVVQVWTINDIKEMRALLAMGVDGIMTDFPARLVETVRQHR